MDAQAPKVKRSKTLGEALVRTLAVEAGVDPRTIRRVVDGEDVKGLSRTRILPVLERHGIALEPTGEEAPAAVEPTQADEPTRGA